MVTQPVSTTQLTATTSDPDGDTVTHWWQVVRMPAGAKAVIVRPGARETYVHGLSLPGEYVFRLTAIDRTKSVSKELIVTVAPKSTAIRPTVRKLEQSLPAKSVSDLDVMH